LPKLGWIEELGGIAQIRGVNLKVLAGSAATMTAISDFLSEPGADLNIWSGHGGPDGLISTDNEEMDGEWIATQAAGGAPETFLIGACYSSARSDYLRSITEQVSGMGINACGFAVSADDKAAATYAIEFVRALSAVRDVTLANRVAIRACAKKNAETAKGVVFTPAAAPGYKEILRAIQKVSDNTDTLSIRVGRVERTQEEILQQFNCMSEPRIKKSRGVVKSIVADRPA